MVDEQPPLESILVLHEAGVQVQGVVVALEVLLDFLSCLVQGVELGLIEVQAVGLEYEGADLAALLHIAGDVDALHRGNLLVGELALTLSAPCLLLFQGCRCGIVLLFETADEVARLIHGKQHVVVDNDLAPLLGAGGPEHAALAEVERIGVQRGIRRDLRLGGVPLQRDDVMHPRSGDRGEVVVGSEALVRYHGDARSPDSRFRPDVGQRQAVGDAACELLVVQRQPHPVLPAEQVEQVDLRLVAHPAVVAQLREGQVPRLADDPVPVDEDEAAVG